MLIGERKLYLGGTEITKAYLGSILVKDAAPPPSGGSISYGGYSFSGDVDGSTYTFTGVPIGAASAGRWVIAAIYGSHNTSRQFSTVTIGGVSASILASGPTLASEGVRMEFWAANVPAGTTANVVVTTPSGQFYDAACATYVATAEPTLHDSAIDTTTASLALSASVDVPAGGGLIAMASNLFAGSTVTWSGATAGSADTAEKIYSAYGTGLGSETGRAVSVTFTETYDFNTVLFVASFSF